MSKLKSLLDEYKSNWGAGARIVFKAGFYGILFPIGIYLVLGTPILFLIEYLFPSFEIPLNDVEFTILLIGLFGPAIIGAEWDDFEMN